MMKTQAIIAAAGTGSRMNSDTIKPLLSLAGRPLLFHTLDVFEKCDLIDGIIVVAFGEKLAEYKRAIGNEGFSKVNAVISGGETRRDSVQKGLKALDEDTQIVVIHDGARPLVTRRLIEESIQVCAEKSSAVAGVPAKATIKRVNPQSRCVEATFNRSLLWEIQTPQTFRRELICRAYFDSEDRGVTDDSSLVEQMGVQVQVIEGDYDNIKVTTQDDLVFAEAVLEKRK